MHLVDTPSTAAEMPPMQAENKPGWFHGGGGGTRPTEIGFEWLNMLQAELLAVLDEANIAPAKATLNQITLAIKTIALSESREALEAHIHADDAHPQYALSSEVDEDISDAIANHNLDSEAHPDFARGEDIAEAIANHEATAHASSTLNYDNEDALLAASGRYVLDASEQNFVVKLPAEPTSWQWVEITAVLGGSGTTVSRPTLNGNGHDVQGSALLNLGFLHHLCSYQARFNGTEWQLIRLGNLSTDLSAWAALVGDWGHPRQADIVGQHVAVISGAELSSIISGGEIYFTPEPDEDYTVQLSGQLTPGALYQQRLTLIPHSDDQEMQGRAYVRSGLTFEQANARGWLPLVDLPAGDVYVSGVLRARDDVEVTL
ncbi:hypothetical protein F9L16_23935 [Agarivorans sp. B2Z047]|uniref:hypothetical protein n=1 Tax=Agarivorans sp. B2Z047 TaxID=2652721 RepID=UPI00128B963C|nr:hypothetical protein [Agarivorans sp. B2Z047]MPW31998.1 hypothetical protein [Agarivorans sp. B2Z047]UQN43752.1 hypothetical protein LQZ07_04585 [Agarivorans sp. B2Z047]